MEGFYRQTMNVGGLHEGDFVWYGNILGIMVVGFNSQACLWCN